MDAEPTSRAVPDSPGGYARAVVERVFREESGRIIASMIRALGDFDRAEEALQDALAAALEHWPKEGVPDNPGAWLTTAARRKAIDRLRRDKVGVSKHATLAGERTVEGEDEFEEAEKSLSTAFEDDRLRLIFTCCHPALAQEAQVALTLRTLGGLTTEEIARAFLVPPETLAQRIVRAKRKIKDAGIPYQAPPASELSERLPAVLSVIYLVFNEGYSAGYGDALVRHELCSEAVRLGRVLTELVPSEPEVEALLALMLLHGSRRAARTGPGGEPVLLEDQDRSLWDRGEIEEGVALLERALARSRPGPYQTQAAIAALHAQAARPGDTDWAQIAALYGELGAMAPSPVVELNRAVAVAMAQGPEAGLKLIDRLGQSGELDDYLWFHSARAELLRRLGRSRDAATAYRRALGLTGNSPGRSFLERRLREVTIKMEPAGPR